MLSYFALRLCAVGSCFGTSEALSRNLFGLGVSGQVPLWSILFIGGLTSLVRVDFYPN